MDSLPLRLLLPAEDGEGKLVYCCQSRTLRLPLQREEREATVRRLAPQQSASPSKTGR